MTVVDATRGMLCDRYMSYQSYVFTSGKPITSLLDAHIKPSWGKNPYSDPSATPEEVRGSVVIQK